MKYLVLLVFLPVFQELDVDALLKQLEDESIEVREKAAVALVKEGAKVEKKLRARIASAQPELKARLEAILKNVARGRLIPPVRNVTLQAKDERLRDVLDRFDSQVQWKVRESRDFNDLRVSVQVKDQSPLEALDVLCKSAGLDFELGSGGYFDESRQFVVPPLPVIQLKQAPLGRAPQTFSGRYRVLADQVSFIRRTRFTSQGTSGNFGLRIEWIPDSHPDLILIQIASVSDDQGRSMHQPKSWWKHAYTKRRWGLEDTPSIAASWELSAPEPDAKRIGSIKGRGQAHFLTDLKYLVLEDAEKRVGTTLEVDGLSVHLREFKREDQFLIVVLETWGAFKPGTPLIAGGAGIRSVQDIELMWKDKAFPARSGMQRECLAKDHGHPVPSMLFRIETRDQEGLIRGLRVRAGASVLEESFEFELKDIPLPK